LIYNQEKPQIYQSPDEKIFKNYNSTHRERSNYEKLCRDTQATIRPDMNQNAKNKLIFWGWGNFAWSKPHGAVPTKVINLKNSSF
jgi:hypothetical protein